MMIMKLRKRALMEANNKGTGEVRRVHVIYFLSRMGHVEQPHLIRVHHLASAGGGGGGVYLRDVKRWLGELRGKEMAERFSWSYKRKYKRGYVWQDLMDDDLITPISDNEYVLQGSQIIPISLFDNSALTSSSSSTTTQTKKSLFTVHQLQLNNIKEDFPSKVVQMNGESPPYDSSERSTVTDDGTDSMKVEEETKNLETVKQGIEEEEEEGIEEIEGFKTQYSSLYAKFLNNKKLHKDLMDNQGGATGTATSTVSSSSSSSTSSSSHPDPAFTKSKSYSIGASNVLRQWITCGAVDTNDAVLIKNPSPKHHPPNQQPSDQKPKNDAVFCRSDDQIGGSARVLGNSWDGIGNLEIHRQYSQQFSRKSLDDSSKKRQKESRGRNVGAAAAATNYKPMAGPNCSLCGKSFRPEKMHSHMKSCRGLKSLAKTGSTSDKTASSKSTTTRSTSDKESACTSTYLLTN